MGFGGSGGGSGSIATSSDVSLSNPADSQVLTYDSATAKWTNQPPAGGGNAGEVLLDSFAGADDDAKLTAAMTYASAQAHPPIIRLTNRDYTFTTARNAYTGFRLFGPVPGAQNAELSAANMGCTVNLKTNGVWLNVTGGDVFDAVVCGIAFVGTSTTTFLGSDGSSIWHCCHIRDVSFKQFKTVLGTQAQRLPMTGCLIDGWFQMQGTYNGGIHIAGSDNRLFLGHTLIDATPAYNTAGNAAGQFHMWFDSLDNTTIGPLYITAEGPWGGVKISGPAYNTGIPSNLGMVTIHGATIEGRNASQPCDGALVRIEGGIAKLRDCYIARGMSSPASMGHTPQDAGIVHIASGGVLLDGITYDRCNGVDETVPFVYNNGGTVRVMDTYVATKGGTWTGLPRVTSPSGTIKADDTVTLV